ncbi:feruloyl-CoA synthase [Caulobacter sp. CCUG 60055]|uniref:AMP-binding protein n=1 Tax=Caulobacter sp. CCUG 60055 TaxID=2100090 RepID=UPI001FA70C32|nr:AMP-binding protein [Caulobacter sp. CCUG 60055]MBQ1543836.1 AMP-binding protein [Caulobacteraceae bacterium]MCI3180702.1 feruloyl-CoA synthase [Caulobacter sp. CCUG 60055]
MEDGSLAQGGIGTRFRDPRYAPRRLEVERRGDGTLVLTNPTAYDDRFQTANAALDHWAAVAPARSWLAERAGQGWRRVGFGEAHGMAAALAGGLRELGLGRGDALLILARNGIDHALISYAAMRIGAAAAPVSPQYGLSGADPARLNHAVGLIGPRCVYVDDAEAFAGALALPALAGLPVVASRNPGPGHVAFGRLLRAAAVENLARPEDAAKLLLTSGSTGRPKAVICTHRNMALNAAQIAACFDDPDPPAVVNAAPWSHSLGANAILHMVLHRGGDLHIDAGQPTPQRFGETVRNLHEVSPTYHNMVPAGWSLFAGELERDEALARTFFARVRVLQYGGAAMPQSVCDRVQAVALRTVGEKITFATGYGSTETGPTACNIHWVNERTGMIGLPVPGTAVKLAPDGAKFEIRVKGPQVSPGYLNAAEASAAAFDEEGFYRLGDAARLAEPDRPEAGLVFDGRLVENFKLASGSFVAAGALRTAAVSAIGGAVADAVVCGEGREGVGLLLFLNAPFCERLGDAAARAAVTAGLAGFNAAASSPGGRVARALILDGAPDPDAGEITDKGYINQALTRERRAAEVERLFASTPDPEVLVF